jgi:hypothetical protein
MHNCKASRSTLIDLALDELQPEQKKQLLMELKECAVCQEEYFSLRSVLRVSDQALRSALPSEDFWTGYHARLSQHIEKGIENHSSVQAARRSRGVGSWSGLGKIATASIRLPVPIAAALVLMLGLSSFFAVRSRGQINVGPSTPLAQVQTRTVEVPVVQEKVVTRVVYVERNRQPSRNVASPPHGAVAPNAPAMAAKSADVRPTTAISLIGFKPTDQVKLKIMKGSYHDEK